jgi:hypothetical protein
VNDIRPIDMLVGGLHWRWTLEMTWKTVTGLNSIRQKRCLYDLRGNWAQCWHWFILEDHFSVISLDQSSSDLRSSHDQTNQTLLSDNLDDFDEIQCRR